MPQASMTRLAALLAQSDNPSEATQAAIDAVLRLTKKKARNEADLAAFYHAQRYDGQHECCPVED